MAKIVGLDFETETDEVGNARLLLCALYGENYTDTFDLRVRKEYERFFYTLILSGHKYVVFNASFDVEIIIIMLLKNGFAFLKNKDKPSHKTMKLIMGQKIYSLTTYFEFEGKMISSQYVDLGNILVGATLKKIAEKFTDLEKGDYEASKDDFEEFTKYCLLDAQITYEAYLRVTSLLGMETLTIGSASFNIMLDMNFHAKTKRGKFGLFKAIYGKNSLEDDKYLRKWYAGGLGWSSTDDRTETRVHSYDIVSAYPAESMKGLPTTNRAIKYHGLKLPTEERPFSFIKMRVTGQVKENHVPVLPSRNIYGDSNIYIYDDKEVYIIAEYGVKSEYDYWLENMDIEDIEYIETISLEQATKNPLRPYMEKYYHIKETTSGIERDLAKRLLNSLTGKLGTNPIKDNVEYELNDNNKLIRKGSEEIEIDVYVTHVVAVITSRVRCKCYEVDTMIRDKTTFRMYATDSVKHSSNVSNLITTGNNLGDWGLEHEDISFIFLGLKAYIFDANNEKGEREVICAGISRNYKPLITNEQFYATTLVKSLVSVRTGNGRILYEGYKRIANPIKKPRRRGLINGTSNKSSKQTRESRLKKIEGKGNRPVSLTTRLEGSL